MALPTDAAPGVDRSVQWFIAAAGLLVASAAVSLLIFPDRTAEYFAWTIKPPLTAAFLGAGYASVVAALLPAAGKRDWRDVRLGVAVVATGLSTILVATLLHLDRFHLNSGTLSARAWAWAWLVWYLVLPPLLAWTLWRQRRRLAGWQAQPSRLPMAFRVATALLALLLVVMGLALFIVPAQAQPLWPWTLTPLTSRMVGAYLIAVGVSLFVTGRSESLAHTRVATPAWVVFGGLQLLQLARFADTLGPPGWPLALLIGWLSALFALGAAGLWAARRAT